MPCLYLFGISTQIHYPPVYDTSLSSMAQAVSLLSFFGVYTGSISSLDDMSFSPMAHALSKEGSDLSVANGMFMDAEPSRSSEVTASCEMHIASAFPYNMQAVATAPAPSEAITSCEWL